MSGKGIRGRTVGEVAEELGLGGEWGKAMPRLALKDLLPCLVMHTTAYDQDKPEEDHARLLIRDAIIFLSRGDARIREMEEHLDKVRSEMLRIDDNSSSSTTSIARGSCASPPITEAEACLQLMEGDNRTARRLQAEIEEKNERIHFLDTELRYALDDLEKEKRKNGTDTTAAKGTLKN